MKIDISDDLFEQYQKLIKKHFLSDSVSENIEQLIKHELLRFGGTDHEYDGLTGCKTRFQLMRDFSAAIYKTSTYVTRYLCLDIDNFGRYGERYNLKAGDAILVEIAKLLERNYPQKNIYRTGGDEFVVELGDAPFVHPQMTAVNIKHSIVNIQIDQDRRGHYDFGRAFSIYIERGIVESSLNGTSITFKYPSIQRAG
jgi:diguanylate cyclase (GGDEF)-like protein